MNWNALVVGSALLVSSVAWADDDTVSAPPPAPPSQLLANDADRYFPLSESAAVPNAFVRAHTTGSYGTGNAFSVGQSVEIVPIQKLAVRVTAQFQPGVGFSPAIQAKYQLLGQESAGVNLSAGLRYKQVGFFGGDSSLSEGETEAFVSVGRSFGRFIASANAVAGINVQDRNEGDVEAHLSLGYQPMDHMLVGVNGYFKQGFGPSAEFKPGESRIEMIAGPVVGYSFGIVDLSLQAGAYIPRGVVNPTVGAIGVMGANFNF